MITSKNIEAFLIYLNQSGIVFFKEDIINNWKSLSDYQINDLLQDIFKQLNLSNEAQEDVVNNFFKDNKFIAEEVQISNAKIIQQTKPIINELAIAEHIELPVTTTLPSLPINTGAPIPIEPLPIKEKTPVTVTYLEANKKSTSKVGLIFTLLILCLLGYLAYKYYTFNTLANVYTLTNNVSIKKNIGGKAIARLDLFGTALDNKLGEQNTYNQLKLIGTKDDYYEVLLTPTFTNYLLHNKDSIYYVHQNITTLNKALHDKYCKVFALLADDYNELDKLQLKYRAMLVDAIEKFPELNNLAIAAPCYKEKKISNKAPLSIGQYKSKNSFGNIDKLYVIAQFTNGHYYTIQGNEQGQVQNIWKTQLTNFGYQEPLLEKGKFSYYDPYQFTYGDFNWENCTKTKKAVCGTEPFANFEMY